MPQPQLSILIVNWRSKEYLRSCLESVNSTCAGLSKQIVVVDGGSFDGCAEMLANEFPEVDFIQSEQNIGFGRSNNLGFESVTGDLLLLLNPDTELKPGAAEILVQELQERPDAGVLGPKLLNTDGSLQTSCVQALPTPLNQALDSNFLRRLFPGSRMWGTAEAFRSAIPIKVEAVSGACMLLRSTIFRKIGGFSPEFFMYGEDMDLCAKVRKLGLCVYHVPAAEVVHHGGGSSREQVSQFSTTMMRIAGETYMQLNHGRFAAFAYRVLQCLSALMRIIILLCSFGFYKTTQHSVVDSSLKKWWFVLRWGCGLTSQEFGVKQTRRRECSVPNLD